MTLFGPPLVFCTPNLADGKQPLLLIVQGQELRLDESLGSESAVLPKYRDMLRRLARDPVGQTIVFELIMRMFFLHILGVRPECLQNRRRAARARVREWCTDGVAAASAACGIFGPILAFRGEIEAQGRGSLHPHILVWLLAMPHHVLLLILQQDTTTLQRNLRSFMRATVAAMESTPQASVQALPRRFKDLETTLPHPQLQCSGEAALQI